jgi:hypothetical protein
MRRRAMILLAALFLMLGITAVAIPGANAHTGTVTASEQHYKIVGVASLSAVGSGFQYQYSSGGYAFINAWNGGPWVKVYDDYAVNNDFTVIQNTHSGYQMIKRTNGSGGNACIGDAHNDPSDARASLDSCGSPVGVNNGWGTDFLISSGYPCSSGQWWFRNVHWSGVDGAYLGPVNNFSNGSNFYLNKPVAAYCFIRTGAS